MNFNQCDYTYLIKIISKEKIVYDNTEYQNVIEKCVFSNRKTFKQGYKELSKKYNEENYLYSVTEERIRVARGRRVTVYLKKRELEITCPHCNKEIKVKF